jgi:hypothetical protein
MERIWSEIRSRFLAELAQQESEASPPQSEEEAAAGIPSGVANHERPNAIPPKAASATKNSLPFYAANAEVARIVLALAAELGRQPGFQANATHLELAYRVHRILVAARQGELAISHGVDWDAVGRFVDEVFFATQFLDEDIHSEAKARASRPFDRPDAAHGLSTSVLIDSVGQSRENDVCRPSSGAGDAEAPNGEFGSDMDAEAHRIAAELVRLHKAGAIKSEQDLSFYAHLIRDFGAAYIGKIMPVAAEREKSEGNPPVGVYVPGKPYTPTAAQRVKVPRGLSRKKEAEFLARDLEEALAYEPTPEELGESVIDLTGDALPASNFSG